MSLPTIRRYNANSPSMRWNNPSPVISLTASINATAYLSVSATSAFAVLTNTLRAHNDKVGDTHTHLTDSDSGGEDCVSDISSPYSPVSSKSPTSTISSVTSVGSVEDKLQTAKQSHQPSLPNNILFPSSGTCRNTSVNSANGKRRCDDVAPVINQHHHRDSRNHPQAPTATPPTPLLFSILFDSDPYLDENLKANRHPQRVSSIKRNERSSPNPVCAPTTRSSTLRTTRKSFSLARLPRQRSSHGPSERAVTNINGDYDARFLTPNALRNAQKRSETIKMAARMRAAELKKNSAALDFSAGPFSREYVRAHSQPSPLRASWVPDESRAHTSLGGGEGPMSAEVPSSPLDADAAFRELLSKPIDLAAYWSKGR